VGEEHVFTYVLESSSGWNQVGFSLSREGGDESEYFYAATLKPVLETYVNGELYATSHEEQSTSLDGNPLFTVNTGLYCLAPQAEPITITLVLYDETGEGFGHYAINLVSFFSRADADLCDFSLP
jgi:hypothetical protein